MKCEKCKNEIENALTIDNVDEFYNKKVKALGNGAMAIVPKTHIGREAVVVIKKRDPRRRK